MARRFSVDIPPAMNDFNDVISLQSNVTHLAQGCISPPEMIRVHRVNVELKNAGKLPRKMNAVNNMISNSIGRHVSKAD